MRAADGSLRPENLLLTPGKMEKKVMSLIIEAFVRHHIFH